MITTQRATVTRACTQLIRELVGLLAARLGTAELPSRSISFTFMAPSGPGRHVGRTFRAREIDWQAIWESLNLESDTLPAYNAAAASIDTYIAVNRIEASGFVTHDIDNHYLRPLLQLYLTRKGAAIFNQSTAKSVVFEMVRHLDTSYVEITSLVILEGFSANRSFRLDPAITVRPITEDELMVLGREDWKYGLFTTRPTPLQPRSDWWICDIQLKSPRGTAEGWNAANDVQANLGFALRAFKGGRLRLGLATKQVTGVFGRAGQIRGGRLDAISTQSNPYTLSSGEINKFQRFWHKIVPLLDKDSHYLQIPIRRLRTAGTRSEKEDALVDYVVGLEALLGKANERTELNFRFKIRGAVLLAPRKAERKNSMKTLDRLYNLRSRIVHGQSVSASHLDEDLPIAEDALRHVWQWYFRNWPDEPNNNAGVGRIDELLVGG